MIAKESDLFSLGVEGSNECNRATRSELNGVLLLNASKITRLNSVRFEWNLF